MGLGARINQIDGTGQIDITGDAYVSELSIGGTAHQLRVMVPVNAERIVVRGNGAGVRLFDARTQKIVVQGAAVIDSTTAPEIDFQSGTLSLPAGYGGFIRYGRAASSLTSTGPTLNASVYFEPLDDDQLLRTQGRRLGIAPIPTGNFTGGGKFVGGFRHDGSANWDFAIVDSNSTVEINGTWQAANGELVLNQSDDPSDRATLRGNGTFLGDVYGGSVDPGRSIGRLTINSFFARGQNSRLSFTLAGTLPAVLYDQLTVLDVLSLDAGADSGALLRIQPHFIPAVGDSFLLVDNRSLSPVLGHFRGLPEGASFDLIFSTYQITYLGGDGNDIVLRVTSSIPEPAAAALIVLTCVLRLRRRAVRA